MQRGAATNASKALLKPLEAHPPAVMQFLYPSEILLFVGRIGCCFRRFCRCVLKVK